MISKVENISNVQNYPLASRKDEAKAECKNIDKLPNVNPSYHPSFTGQKSEVPLVEVYQTIYTQKPFSSGLKGDVYKLDYNGRSYAIKVGKTPSDDFSNEVKILKNVPPEFKNSQQFVAHTKDPINGHDVLVTTFASGKSGCLASKKDFDECFSNLLILDKAGVLHGDLGMGNFLFDDDGVKLIDYGEGSIFDRGESYVEMYPEFVVKSNAVNLEQNGIPDCIKKWKADKLDSLSLFKDYLSSKADYYSKHSEMINTRHEHDFSVEYEENLAKVLKNPSGRVVQNELERIDLLSTFEQADTAVNYDKYPLMGIRNWNLTMQKAEGFLESVHKNLCSESLSHDERLYFEFQEMIAENLFKDFSDWSKSTIDWIRESLEKDDSLLGAHEAEFKKNVNKKSPMPDDLVAAVLSENL